MNSCKLWMEFAQFSNRAKVVLLTDRFSSEGIPPGSLGMIVELYEDEFYEIEFPHAQVIVQGREIKLADD